MSKDTLPTLIATIGSILGLLVVGLLSGVGWLVVQVWDMHPKVTETAYRVDRIVDVLPEVRRRVAEEDWRKRVEVAFIASDPIENASGQWVQRVDIDDYILGKRQVFDIPLRGPQDQTGAYLVTGLVSSIAMEKISFADYSSIAAKMGKPPLSDADIDLAASFAIIKPSAEYWQRIEELFGKPSREAQILKRKLLVEQLEEVLRMREKEIDRMLKESPSAIPSPSSK